LAVPRLDSTGPPVKSGKNNLKKKQNFLAVDFFAGKMEDLELLPTGYNAVLNMLLRAVI
jgi:hypothetical protein